MAEPETLFFSNFNQVPPGVWRWPNFSPREIASKREGELKIHTPSLDALQRLRDALGTPLLITSGYRSAAHNAAVGGAKNSYHMRGQAFDVRMDNQDPMIFEREARRAGFRGIIRYPASGFIHIDTRATPYDAGPAFPLTASALPVETVPRPENLREDRAAVAATGVGAAGAVAAVAEVLPHAGFIGTLAPTAQMIAVLAMVALAAYIIFVRSRR